MAVLYSFGEKNEAFTDREGILRKKMDKIRHAHYSMKYAVLENNAEC